MPITRQERIARRVRISRRETGGARDGMATLDEAKVYIWLSDMHSKDQKFETDYYVSLLKKICQSYGVPFSFNVVEGGYIHDDGEYTEEKSIVLTFVDIPEKTVEEVAAETCVLFNQESVLVTFGQVRMENVLAAH